MGSCCSASPTSGNLSSRAWSSSAPWALIASVCNMAPAPEPKKRDPNEERNDNVQAIPFCRRGLHGGGLFRLRQGAEIDRYHGGFAWKSVLRVAREGGHGCSAQDQSER